MHPDFPTTISAGCFKNKKMKKVNTGNGIIFVSSKNKYIFLGNGEPFRNLRFYCKIAELSYSTLSKKKFPFIYKGVKFERVVL